MQYNFTAACKEVRAGIPVPAVPLAAIRSGAERPLIASRPRATFPLVVAGLSIALIATVAATWTQTQVWVGNGHVRVSSEQASTIQNPTPAELGAAARGADFPVVLPTGLPQGAKPVVLYRGGVSALMIAYALPGAQRATNHVAWIVVANPKSFDWDRPSLPRAVREHARTLQVGTRIAAIFVVGGELVVIPKGSLSAREINAVEHAMGVGIGRSVSADGLHVRNPTAADLAAAARAVAFPAGLPAGRIAIGMERSR